MDLRDEEALQLWVEREAERIGSMLQTRGFYLATTGQLLEKADAGEGAG